MWKRRLAVLLPLLDGHLRLHKHAKLIRQQLDADHHQLPVERKDDLIYIVGSCLWGLLLSHRDGAPALLWMEVQFLLRSLAQGQAQGTDGYVYDQEGVGARLLLLLHL